jgi:peptide-methionine (S)-S-oxide reductase
MIKLNHMRLAIVSLAACLMVAGSSCGQKNKKEGKTMVNEVSSKAGLETATFGSGCFWCTEAIFLNVDGVEQVVSGYMGGKVKNPTYKEVCSGLTGHAEVIQLTYNPAVVSYEELLEIFWQTHDPTTLNRQGADEGTQYRSVVFYHNDEQKQLAEFYKKKLDDAKAFSDPIVTEITAASDFYKAEDYHQNYYNLNSNAPYCSFVIQPKLQKFKKVFKEKLKEGL